MISNKPYTFTIKQLTSFFRKLKSSGFPNPSTKKGSAREFSHLKVMKYQGQI